MKTKKCSKCDKTFPLTKEYFHLNKSNEDGFQNACKVCRNESNRIKQRERYKTNKDKMLASSKKYQEKNAEKIKKQQKEYRQKLKTNNRELYLEKERERRKKYREKNKEKVNEYYRNYRKQYRKTERGRAILNISQYKSQARLWYGEIKDDFDVDDWFNALKYFKYSCAYCGVECKELLQEHVNPLSISKDYTKLNIVPSCFSCNTAKKSKNLNEFYNYSSSFTLERYENILNYFRSIESTCKNKTTNFQPIIKTTKEAVNVEEVEEVEEVEIYSKIIFTDDIQLDLDFIANYIRNGQLKGQLPTWDLIIYNNDLDSDYIADLVEKGYKTDINMDWVLEISMYSFESF